MKRILVFVIAASVLLLPGYGQNEEKLKELENLETKTVQQISPDTVVPEQSDPEQTPETQIATNTEEVTEEVADEVSVFTIGDNVFKVEETDDETLIRIGRRGVRIIDEGDDTDIDFEEFYDEDDDSESNAQRFEGHLGGIEIGYNSYLNDAWSMSLPAEYNYMNLHSAKSSCFNFVFPSIDLGITRHFGLVAAVGLNWNNYRFDGNNTIGVDPDNGEIEALYPIAGISFEKSKLTTVYAILPVILEAQIPVSQGSTINIGAGVIGAVKLGSHTKVVYYDDGKQNEKNKDDFNLSLLRYGATARIGYEMIQIYSTCYLSQLFEKGKGPELYPFEVGISLTIND